MPMSEREWLNCENPLRMFRRVRRRASERKARLLGCALLNAALARNPYKPSESLVKAQERYAEGRLRRLPRVPETVQDWVGEQDAQAFALAALECWLKPPVAPQATVERGL
jgi:hypothetical protein